MPSRRLTSIDAAEIVAALRAVEPTVRFALPRVLRRVIKRDRNLTGALVQVPHRKSLVIDGQHLALHVRRSELFPETAADLPPQVILLPYPRPQQILDRGREGSLLHWWRLLFHAKIHAELETPVAMARLSQASLRERIDQLGQTFFDEVRRVLGQEHFVLPPRNDLSEYVEFAAVFLEFFHFAPALILRYFPSCDDPARIAKVLGRDVDGATIFRSTRPAGAPDPTTYADGGPRPIRRRFRNREDPRARRQRLQKDRSAGALLLEAERARSRGNVVRAAILRQRVEAGDRPLEEVAPSSEARRDLERLTTRIKEALDVDRATGQAWHAALENLLPDAAAGFRAPEARLLYDLQKVCVDHERGVHFVDLVGVVLSAGRRPLKRLLPYQREVMIVRHLRAASSRLYGLCAPDDELATLESLLEQAKERAEHDLRSKVRGEIERVLERVGLRPSNIPEAVARKKLVEELLDRVVERGFLNLGDLRDAVSRNQIKLDDCRNFAEFWSADRLLDADRALATSLDGIYHRGEVYMRWLQRLSAVTFGTEEGRLLTRFVIMPFGGAFLVLEGLQHMLHKVLAVVAGLEIGLRTWWSVLLLGVWFLGIIHVPRVRTTSGTLFRGIGRGFKLAFWSIPLTLARLPTLRALLDSVAYKTMARYVLKPAILAGLVFLPFPIFGAAPEWLLSVACGLFLLFNFFLNSPIGVALEEWILDVTGRGLDRVRTRLVVSAIRFVIHLFKRALETLEGFLYGVDEWSRFRTGESRAALVLKGVAGSIWRGINYVVRLYITLLIEPQVNPIKHFPVVTVTHKMIIPMYPQLFEGFLLLFVPLGPFLADLLAGATVFLLPGLFGFLVWEFKENWKLYAANRPLRLRPVLIGHHGETLLRLMKPGFHSGTLPKLYARLRRIERKPMFARRPGARRRLFDQIHQVEHAIGDWVTRELLVLLSVIPEFKDRRFAIGHVDAGSNRVRVAIGCDGDPAGDFELAFDEQSGLVAVGVQKSGWTGGLDGPSALAFQNALAGLYKTAGVDLVRGELEDFLGKPVPPYDIADDGLVVFPGPGFENREVLSLRPPTKPGERDASPLLLSAKPLLWSDWVATWEGPAGR